MRSLVIFLLSTFYLNAMGAPCDGAPGRYYVNPDGSQGGFVQKGAAITDSVYLDSSSEICDKVVINGNPKIEAGSSIRESVKIEGSPTIQGSYIYGNAKVTGRAFIQNSEVCQASLIEGIKVISSNYYCQTEDPQPKDPGLDNFKTLLGIDSDGDGVRDDVEIFINKTLSNTPKKNYARERISTKLLAKIHQKELLLKDNSEILKSLYKEKEDLINCYPTILSDDVILEMYDTKERILALAKISGAMHGEDVATPTKKCKTLSGFNSIIDKF